MGKQKFDATSAIKSLAMNNTKEKILNRLYTITSVCSFCGSYKCSHEGNRELPSKLNVGDVLRAINHDEYFFEESAEEKTVDNNTEAEPRDHQLKIWSQLYSEIVDRKRKFEIRTNDRDFRVGDRLTLMSWNPETHEPTGQQVQRTITNIMSFSDIPVEILNTLGANPLPAEMSNIVFLSLE